MLKGIIQKILDELQSKLLEDFQPEDLQLSIAKGDIKIREVSVKQELLRNLHPLLLIHRVVIQNIAAKFSVTKLRYEPIVIDVDGVFILLSPKVQTNLTYEEILQFIAFQTEYKLKMALIFQSICEEVFQLVEKYKTSKFVRHYLNGILKNIKVNVSNVVVKYEDESAAFCLTAMIKRVFVDTVEIKAVNGKAVEISTSVRDNIARFTKKIQVSDLSVAVSNHFISFSRLKDKAAVVKLMRQLIKEGGDSIIGPMLCKILLHIDTTEPSYQFYGPFIKCVIVLDKTHLNISLEQFSQILTQLQRFASKINLKERIFRPLGGLSAGWWAYLLRETEKSKLNNQLMYQAYISLFSKYYIAFNAERKKDAEDADAFYRLLSYAEYKVIELLHTQFSLLDILVCRLVVITELQNSYFKVLAKYQFRLTLNSDDIEAKIKSIALNLDYSADYPSNFVVLVIKMHIIEFSAQICKYIQPKQALATDTANLSKEAIAVSRILKLVVYRVYLDLSLKAQKMFILQARVQGFQLKNCTFKDEPLIACSTHNYARKILDNLRGEALADAGAQFFSFGLERISLQKYDLHAKLELETILVFVRAELFLMLQRIKEGVADVQNQQKNHSFIVDLARNLIRYYKYQNLSNKRLIRSPADHRIVHVDFLMQSPIIIIPDGQRAGQFMIVAVGRVSFNSHVAKLGLDYSHVPRFDDYELAIKQSCAFKINALEQFEYVYTNLDYMGFPEFTSIAKRYFLLMPTDFNCYLRYCFWKQNTEDIEFDLKCKSLPILVNITNSSIRMLTYTAETVIRNFQELDFNIFARRREKAGARKMSGFLLGSTGGGQTDSMIEKLYNLLQPLLRTPEQNFSMNRSQANKIKLDLHIAEVNIDVSYLEADDSYHRLLRIHIETLKLQLLAAYTRYTLSCSIDQIDVYDNSIEQKIVSFERHQNDHPAVGLYTHLLTRKDQYFKGTYIMARAYLGKIVFCYNPQLLIMLSAFEANILALFQDISRAYTRTRVYQLTYSYLESEDTLNLGELLDGGTAALEATEQSSELYQVFIDAEGLEVNLDDTSGAIAKLILSAAHLKVTFRENMLGINVQLKGISLFDEYMLTYHHDAVFAPPDASNLLFLDLEYYYPGFRSATTGAVRIECRVEQSLQVVVMLRFLQMLGYYLKYQKHYLSALIKRVLPGHKKRIKLYFNTEEMWRFLQIIHIDVDIATPQMYLPLNDRSSTGLKVNVGRLRLFRYATGGQPEVMAKFACICSGITVFDDRGQSLIADIIIEASACFLRRREAYSPVYGFKFDLSIGLPYNLTLSQHCLRLIQRMFNPSNNLGYNLADTLYQDDYQIDKLMQMVGHAFTKTANKNGSDAIDIAAEFYKIYDRQISVDCDMLQNRLRARAALAIQETPSLVAQIMACELEISIYLSRSETELLNENSETALRLFFGGIGIEIKSVQGGPMMSIKIGHFYVYDPFVARVYPTMSYLLRSENNIILSALYQNNQLELKLYSNNNLVKLQYISGAILFLLQSTRGELGQLDIEVLQIRKQCLRRQEKCKKLKYVITLNSSTENERRELYVDKRYLQHIYHYELYKNMAKLQTNDWQLSVAYSFEMPAIQIVIPENSLDTSGKYLCANMLTRVSGQFLTKKLRKFDLNDEILRYFSRKKHTIYFQLFKFQLYVSNQYDNVSYPVLDRLEVTVGVKYCEQDIFVPASQNFISEQRNFNAQVQFNSQVKITLNYSDMVFVARLVQEFYVSFYNIVNSYIESSASRDVSLLSSKENSCILSQDAYVSQQQTTKSLSRELTNYNLLRQEAKLIGYRKLYKSELPIFLNSYIIVVSYLNDHPVSIQVLDDNEIGMPVCRIILQRSSGNIYLDNVYIVQYSIDLIMNALLSFRVYTYNCNNYHWESLISGCTLSASCSTAPKYYEHEDIHENFTDIQLEIYKITMNLSPIIIAQMNRLLQIGYYFFSDRSRLRESSFFSLQDYNICTPESYSIKETKPSLSIYNYSRFTVAYKDARILSYHLFNLFEDLALLDLSIKSENATCNVQNILCYDGYMQLVEIEGVCILVQVQYANRLLRVLVREKYYIVNYSKSPVWFGSQRLSGEFFTANDIIEIGIADNNFLFNLAQIPASIQIGRYFFRVAFYIVNSLQHRFYEIAIHPTYLIVNECVDRIEIDGIAVSPFEKIEAYVNPLYDFAFRSVQYAGFSAREVRICAKRGNSSEEDDEAENQILLYDFESKIRLKKERKAYVLGLKRQFEQQTNWNNPFNHQVVIYPFYIMRNCFCLANDKLETAFSIKNPENQAEIFEYRCGSGDFEQLGIDESQPINAFCYLLDYGTHAYQVCSSMSILKVVSTIRADNTAENSLPALLQFSWTKNYLTRVITLFPSRIVRNHSGLPLRLYFGSVPLHTRDRFIELQDNDAPAIVRFPDKFVYVEYYTSVSSAFSLEGSSCYLIVFKKNPTKLALQTSMCKEIQLIDVFDAQDHSTIQVYNQTNYTLLVRYCFDFTDIIKGKVMPHASIDTFDVEYCLVPQFAWQYFDLFDVSVPPVLEVKLLNQVFNVTLTKIGKRKPLQCNGFSIFVQVDIRHEKYIVIVSTKPIQRETLLYKAHHEFEFDQVLTKLSFCVKDVGLSYYALTKCQVNGQYRNVPTEMFRLMAQSLQTNIFKLEYTTAIDIQLANLQLLNVYPNKEFGSVFRLRKYNNQPVVSLQAEKLNYSMQFSGIQISVADMEISIDYSTLDPILRVFAEFYQFEPRIRYVGYDNEQIRAVVAHHLLPFDFVLPKREMDLSALFLATLHVSELQITLNVSLQNVKPLLGESTAAALLGLLGGSVTSIQNARLQMNALGIRNFIGQKNQLIHRVRDFYTTEARHNAFYLLRAAGLFGSIGDSSWRIQESAERIFDAEGLARLQGIALVGQSIVAGYGGAVSGVAQAVYSVAGALSFDAEYAATERRRVRDSHRGVRNALVNSALAAGTGIVEAFTGLVTQPVRGAAGGFLGALAGFGKGVLGFVTKPVAGIAGAVGHLGVAVTVAASGAEETESAVQRVWRSGVIDE